MPTVRRVLVPSDFSPSSRSALEYGVFLAASFGAVVDLLHVVEPPGYVGPDALALLPTAASEGGAELTRRELVSEVERFLPRAGPRPPEYRIHIESGQPGETILRVAAVESADLIVMGTHGRTGLARVVLGSVAEAVLRRAPCPVVTIRMASRAPRESVPF